ncbi:MAG TPA: flagellar basal-body MS-ring/collar protein FliF [Allosphingosinicella sp.]|jgi:flagellar M-ring protein FliF
MLERFKAATPARQLAAILSAVAVVAALLAIVYFAWFRTSYAVLFSNLREADAASIVGELDKKQVPYRLEAGGRTILVPAGEVDTTRLAVMGQDLPLKGMVGFEVFDTSGLGLTEFAQRINYQRALQGELARTIMAIDGVESARIHLALAEQTVFRGDRKPSRASVTVLMRAGSRLTEPTVRGIQRLVAAAVPELEPSAVVVLNGQGAIASADTAADVPFVPGMEEKRRVEQFYEARIRRQLEIRYPRQGIEVVVWAAAGDRQPLMQAAPAAGAPGAARRDFGLRVGVTVSGPVSGETQQQINDLVADAIGLDSTLGDAVSVTSAPGRGGGAGGWSQELEAAEAIRPRGSEESAPASWLTGLWTPAALFLILGFVFLWSRRTAAPSAMGEDQRLDYANRLKLLLDQREADVAPRV